MVVTVVGGELARAGPKAIAVSDDHAFDAHILEQGHAGQIAVQKIVAVWLFQMMAVFSLNMRSFDIPRAVHDLEFIRLLRHGGPGVVVLLLEYFPGHVGGCERYCMASDACLACEREIILQLLILSPTGAVGGRQHTENNCVFHELLGLLGCRPGLSFLACVTAGDSET